MTQFASQCDSNLNNLKICRTCFELYGHIRFADGHEVEQRCHCNYVAGEKNWEFHVIDGTHIGSLHSKDFNKLYETCYCCGLEVIGSGSRFSSFHCNYCQEKVRELNREVGNCVIPVARHSIINGFSLSGAQLADRNAIAQFLAKADEMSDGISKLYKHRNTILKKQIKMVGLSESGSVFEFIEKTKEIENINCLKDAAFYRLMAFMLGKPVAEVRKFHREYIDQSRWMVGVPFKRVVSDFIKCNNYTLAIRNEALAKKYNGGLQAFVKKHRTRHNNSITIVVKRYDYYFDDLIKELKANELIVLDDFVVFNALMGASISFQNLSTRKLHIEYEICSWLKLCVSQEGSLACYRNEADCKFCEA